MPYRGEFPPATVRVTLRLDASAQGPASLFVAWAGSRGSGSDNDETVVNPGSDGTVEVSAEGKGRCRVEVDMAADSDRGHLAVSAGGFSDGADVVGDQTWTYAVVP